MSICWNRAFNPPKLVSDSASAYAGACRPRFGHQSGLLHRRIIQSPVLPSGTHPIQRAFPLLLRPPEAWGKRAVRTSPRRRFMGRPVRQNHFRPDQQICGFRCHPVQFFFRPRTLLPVAHRLLQRRELGGTAGVPGTPYLITGVRPWASWSSIMARLARVFAPGLPHHIALRANRRQQAFFPTGPQLACLPRPSVSRSGILRRQKPGRKGRPRS